MKFEKKLYSIVLAVAMLFALVLPASAKSDDETANIYIAIVDGYDKAVSEAEFFTIKEQIKNGTLDKEAFIESALKNRSSIEVSYFPVEIVAASPVPQATTYSLTKNTIKAKTTTKYTATSGTGFYIKDDGSILMEATFATTPKNSTVSGQIFPDGKVLATKAIPSKKIRVGIAISGTGEYSVNVTNGDSANLVMNSGSITVST